MPKRPLVLALGNPLQGDDGFGRAVLERLARDPRVVESADLCDAGTDLLGQLERMSVRARVVLIDACLDRSEPGGRVSTLSEAEMLAAARRTAPGAHSGAPVETLALYRLLYPGATGRIDWVLWHTPELRVGSGLSAPDAAERGAEAVREILGLEHPRQHARAG